MDWHRLLSGLLAATYVVLTYRSCDIGPAIMTMVKCLLPLACIWWPGELGQYAGTIRLQIMSRPTPAGLVRFGGWALLLMPIWLPIIVWAMEPLCGYHVRK